MKLFGLVAAAAMAGGIALAAPADAQDYHHNRGWHGNGGWHHGYRGNGWHGGGYRGGEYRHGYGYGYGYGYRPAYGYGYHGGGYGHGRLICRLHHGRYGLVRRCVRV